MSESGGAVVNVGAQVGGGQRPYEFGYVISAVLRAAVADVRLRSLDSRVQKLAILLRISGPLLVFEGFDVEEVRFGRRRQSISVDWLYGRHCTDLRDVDTLVSLVVARLRMTPKVVASVCRKRKVDVDESLLAAEFEQIASVVPELAHDAVRFKAWKAMYMGNQMRWPPEERCYYE